MRNRIWGPLALGGALLSSTAFAANCKNLVLYENGSSKGHMEESTRSFPEPPEWSANWGDFDNMKSPYIRLSGMRNYHGDWTGSLVLTPFLLWCREAPEAEGPLHPGGKLGCLAFGARR